MPDLCYRAVLADVVHEGWMPARRAAQFHPEYPLLAAERNRLDRGRSRRCESVLTVLRCSTSANPFGSRRWPNNSAQQHTPPARHRLHRAATGRRAARRPAGQERGRPPTHPPAHHTRVRAPTVDRRCAVARRWRVDCRRAGTLGTALGVELRAATCPLTRRVYLRRSGHSSHEVHHRRAERAAACDADEKPTNRSCYVRHRDTVHVNEQVVAGCARPLPAGSAN